jgi:hypothetical protein
MLCITTIRWQQHLLLAGVPQEDEPATIYAGYRYRVNAVCRLPRLVRKSVHCMGKVAPLHRRRPSRLLEGSAGPHPDLIVETSSLASIAAPDITYKHSIQVQCAAATPPGRCLTTTSHVSRCLSLHKTCCSGSDMACARSAI